MPAWLTRTMATGFYRYMENQASARKSAQFIRLVCAAFADVFTDPRSSAAIEAADEFEAGIIDEPTFRAAVQAAEDVRREEQERRQQHLAVERQRMLAGGRPNPTAASAMGASLAAHVAYYVSAEGYYDGVIAHLRDAAGFSGQAELARSILDIMRAAYWELFGNPFNPVTLDPAWRTEAVVGLAAGIYADRAFDRLPALAAALEAAGCADADVLGHCRGPGPGPHARGCWVVDLLLGKT
jgi:hypothetical protein